MVLRRSKCFHQSTPSLFQSINQSGSFNSNKSGFVSSGGNTSTELRNELEEKYFDLRDQHQELSRQALRAQDQVRTLTSRVQRLLAEKKRYYRNARSEREVMLEEQLIELERHALQTERQNERLKERLLMARLEETSSPRYKYLANRSGVTVTTAQYEHVRSRTDSGLVFHQSSSLKNKQRARSTTDLRPRSVQFREPLTDKDDDENEKQSVKASKNNQSLPFVATRLMQEAKDEIVRLEKIIVEQQRLIESLQKRQSKPLTDSVVDNLNANHTDNAANTIDQYQDHQKYGSAATIITNTNTTYTTSTNSTTTTINLNSKFPENFNSQEMLVNNGDNIEILWSKYQQIVMQKESYKRISSDVQQLIERLYRMLHNEKQKLNQLKMKLSSLPEYTTALAEKDKQIETLRKENIILQRSLQQCVDQCMLVMNGLVNNESNEKTLKPANDNDGEDDEDEPTTQSASIKMTSAMSYANQIQDAWRKKQKIFEEEVDTFEKKLTSLSESLNEQNTENESLRLKYEQIKKLNENDQLKIRHLEDKVKRLSLIVFVEDEENLQSQQSERSSFEAQRPSLSLLDAKIDHEQSETLTATENNNLESFSELDELLNSLPQN